MSADFESNLISVERIKEYCQTPHEASWIIENNRPDIYWPENGNVIFSDYSVKYRDELDFVLKNINCDIRPGEKVKFLIENLKSISKILIHHQTKDWCGRKNWSRKKQFNFSTF